MNRVGGAVEVASTKLLGNDFMSYQLLNSSTPKARKEHRCEYCGEKILVGETYLREKSVYDGHMQNCAFHPECSEKELKEHAGECEWEREPFEGGERPRKPEAASS